MNDAKRATLVSRLEAIGYEAYEARGKVWLDRNHVDCIVDHIPISFTRRRYSNTTFCWVEAYVGGWFSLGDPWQKVTPSHKDIADALYALERRQSANPAN